MPRPAADDASVRQERSNYRIRFNVFSYERNTKVKISVILSKNRKFNFIDLNNITVRLRW